MLARRISCLFVSGPTTLLRDGSTAGHPVSLSGVPFSVRPPSTGLPHCVLI
jgi:hypothetical protein